MRPACTLAAVSLLAALVLPPADAGAEGEGAGYRATLLRWRAAEKGFSGWELAGAARQADGTLVLDPAGAQAGQDPPGAFHSRNFYNGAGYGVGEATSPLTPTGFGFTRAVPSWNARTPPGTWIEVEARAQVAGRLTRFYNLGVWAADGSTVERHSVDAQRDDDAKVAVDTLVLGDAVPAADAVQLRVRLFSARPAEVTPTVTLAAVAVSTTPQRPPSTSTGDPTRWGKVLEVPTCSQRAYPDGGEVWCSPTSTSMVVGYWTKDAGPCEGRVRAAVAGVYDWVFDGHGNWPFNTAYAASATGGEGYVTRLTGLAEAERWIAAGVPLVLSYSWAEGQLSGAPVNSSEGHLGVLVGFDTSGNPVMNDPAGAGDGEVRRTYPRADFEAVWLDHSGGTAYVVHPSGTVVP
jgi:peptidase C39-like protein